MISTLLTRFVPSQWTMYEFACSSFSKLVPVKKPFRWQLEVNLQAVHIFSWTANEMHEDSFRHRSKKQLGNGSFKRFVPALRTIKMDYPGIYKIPKAPSTHEANYCSLLIRLFVCFFQLCLSDPVHCYPLWMLVRDKLHECHSVYGQETFQHLMECLDSAVATQLANFINH